MKPVKEKKPAAFKRDDVIEEMRVADVRGWLKAGIGFDIMEAGEL